MKNLLLIVAFSALQLAFSVGDNLKLSSRPLRRQYSRSSATTGSLLKINQTVCLSNAKLLSGLVEIVEDLKNATVKPIRSSCPDLTLRLNPNVCIEQSDGSWQMVPTEGLCLLSGIIKAGYVVSSKQPLSLGAPLGAVGKTCTDSPLPSSALIPYIQGVDPPIYFSLLNGEPKYLNALLRIDPLTELSTQYQIQTLEQGACIKFDGIVYSGYVESPSEFVSPIEGGCEKGFLLEKGVVLGTVVRNKTQTYTLMPEGGECITKGYLRAGRLFAYESEIVYKPFVNISDFPCTGPEFGIYAFPGVIVLNPLPQPPIPYNRPTYNEYKKDSSDSSDNYGEGDDSYEDDPQLLPNDFFKTINGLIETKLIRRLAPYFY